MGIPVHIAASGARTPLGPQLEAAAAIRAGVSCMSEHPYLVDRLGNPMQAAFDQEIGPVAAGSERLLALAETALRDACAPIAKANNGHLSLPLFLGLPEPRPGFTQQDARDIQQGLSRLEGLPVELSEIRVATKGHAGGLMALAKAHEQIQQGRFEACLVGGVDSYLSPDTLEWLEANRQLMTDETRSSFVPGEAAGFCLLLAATACERLGLAPMARVLSAAVGTETKLIKTPDTCLGEGLTATVRDALSGLDPSKTINSIICDINGERYRGEEWGFVCLKLSQHFDDPCAYRSPADLWGDIGAASGPMFAVLACEPAARGYVTGRRVMLWAGSEAGQRAVAILETTGNE